MKSTRKPATHPSPAAAPVILDPLLSTPQVAAALGLGVQTVVNKRARHGCAWLPFIRIEGRVRYKPADVAAFIAEREARTRAVDQFAAVA